MSSRFLFNWTACEGIHKTRDTIRNTDMNRKIINLVWDLLQLKGLNDNTINNFKKSLITWESSGLEIWI